MVVGAGALGNEILKNLALLGVGRVLVVDMDLVEASNLSRSVLFRPADEGRPKAEVAASRLGELNPDVECIGLRANVCTDLGLGVFRNVDVVIAGLDNREARLHINHACWKVGRPWVDGAIEVLHGVARVFVPPSGPCFECTLTAADYRALSVRRSCLLLSRQELEAGRVPTTPTTSSVIAGIQVQEAVKLLHGREELGSLIGRGFFFNGGTHDSYVIQYQVREDCPAHECFTSVEILDGASDRWSLADLLARAREDLGPDAVLEFSLEMVTSFRCAACDFVEEVFRPLLALRHTDARCPGCGEVRIPEMVHAVHGGEGYLARTASEFGLPPGDIVTARTGMQMRHYELQADLRTLLPGWTDGQGG